jgi:hypothetical protein
MTRPRDDLAPAERLAHRLLDALQFDRRFTRRFDHLLENEEARAHRTPAMQLALEKRLRAREKQLDAAPVRDALVTHYATCLTDGDLRTLIEFFESSVGRKFVSVWQSDHSPVLKVLADVPRAVDAGESPRISDGPESSAM